MDLFFILSKVLWALATPDMLLLLILAIGLLSLLRGYKRTGTWLMRTALSFCFLLSTLPLGDLLLQPLERAFPAKPEINDPKAIIILGGWEDHFAKVKAGVIRTNEGAERVLEGLRLAKLHPNAKIIFSGGRNDFRPPSDGFSKEIRQLVRDYGIAGDRILIETQSRNTVQNAKMSRSLVNSPQDGPWVLVTSAFHMYRSLGSFCAAGWREIIPYPVDFRSSKTLEFRRPRFAEHMNVLNVGVHEWIGLIIYRWTGRTQSFLQNACEAN